MAKVTFDYSKTAEFISKDEITSMKKLVLDAKETLVSKNGAGNEENRRRCKRSFG